MSIFLPVNNSGVIPFEDREVIYSAPAALVVRVADVAPVSSKAAFRLSGVKNSPAIGGERIRGERQTCARASLQEGNFPASFALASLSPGRVFFPAAFAAFGITSENSFNAIAGLITRQENSVLGAIIYFGIAALVLRSEVSGVSRATIRARDQRTDPGKAALVVRKFGEYDTAGSLSIGQDRLTEAEANITTGGEVSGKPLAAVEVESGEGIDLIIDIIDDILYGGHGDNC